MLTTTLENIHSESLYLYTGNYNLNLLKKMIYMTCVLNE